MKKIIVYADPKYWELTKEQKDNICNGCGAKGAWYNFLIPFKKIFEEVCHIHDYDYHIGKNKRDKDIGDRRFINNLKRVVESVDNKAKKVLLKRVARIYFKSVRDFGDESFWKDKIVNNGIGKEIEI